MCGALRKRRAAAVVDDRGGQRVSILEESSILVTGGTDPFGKAFIRPVLDNHNPKRVTIDSRDDTVGG